VAAAPGLGVRLTGAEPVRDQPDARILAAVRTADPHEVRVIEFSGPQEMKTRWAQAAAREAAGAQHPGEGGAT
jgi:hypothetical protein